MSYRNVDYTKKKKSKPSTKKSNLVKSDETGTFKYERTGTRHGKKKKYLTNFSDIKARAKEKMTSNKAYSASTFKEAFDAASKAGKSKFLHKGKGYLTTKGKREDRFDPTKTKAVANLEQRRMKKRVMDMRKRKKEGKSYSAKNLSELTAKLEKQNIL